MKKNTTAKSSVRFDQVTKVFGKNTVAVDNLSATIESGKLVTLLGPSGCGKTTVLRMIAGLEMPTTGKIFLGETDITNLPASDRDISMVFQSYALFPHMNVLKNVSYGLKFSNLSADEVTDRAHRGLKLVGLSHLANRLPSQLSGGQQQRVAVARALVLEPEVLLFDEPLSNLDAKLRRSVREEIRDLQQSLKLTVVYVTHDQEEALAVSDHIIVMKSAKLAQQGSPENIYRYPIDTFVANFIGDANLIEAEIIKIKGKQALVQLGGNRFQVAMGSYPPHNPHNHSSTFAKVAIRPSHFQIKTIPKKKSPTKANTLIAKVIKSTYLGIRMEYTLETGGKKLFVTSQNLLSPSRVGDWVELYCDPSAAILVKDEEKESI